MRTTTVTVEGNTLQIDYPNSIAFFYSRQPVIVTAPIGAGSLTGVEVTVSTSTGESHTERRAFHNDRAEFDISRTMQLLATEVDNVLRRIDLRPGATLTNKYTITFRATTASGVTSDLLEAEVIGMYGALDQGEIYGEHTQRRLWVNFPQTFNLWKDKEGKIAFMTDSAIIEPETAAGTSCSECDFVAALEALGETQLLQSLRNGAPLRNLGLTWVSRIEDGQETEETLRTLTLVPDNRQRCEGTYLRWINRRGELSYFLFTNSKLRVTSAVSDSFTRYYEGDPSALVRSGFMNPQKACYREGREMVLGATGLSLDEFEDLCDLATSPVIERLMPEIASNDTPTDYLFAGGDATDSEALIDVDAEATGDTEIVPGGAQIASAHTSVNKWQRVNIVAGTFERNIRRSTPSSQDLEIIIELPERNTIKL